MKNVYLLSLNYQNITQKSPDPAQINTNISETFANLTKDITTSFEVRVGYIGLCVSASAGVWVCSGSVRGLADLVRGRDIEDPLNLIWIAGKFKDEIVFNGFV
jgi:hypothetical protein